MTIQLLRLLKYFNIDAVLCGGIPPQRTVFVIHTGTVFTLCLQIHESQCEWK
jgi:hypothetical protein